MSAAQPVTEADFKKLVLENDKPVVVDFWAEWCGPCRKLGPIIDDLAKEVGDKVDVYKVNVDEQRGLGIAYQIMSIPTVMIFYKGEKLASMTGVKPKSSYLAKLQPYL